MSPAQMTFEIIKLCLLLMAAIFTYYKFFREGEHKQRIQFDINCRELGHVALEKIIELECAAENKGNLEQRFKDIRVVVRGIGEGEALYELEGHQPRLSFPQELIKASLVSTKWGYFFVRPRVIQKFPLVIKLPVSITHILVRATFQYQRTGDVHITEKAFCLNQK